MSWTASDPAGGPATRTRTCTQVLADGWCTAPTTWPVTPVPSPSKKARSGPCLLLLGCGGFINERTHGGNPSSGTKARCWQRPKPRGRGVCAGGFERMRAYAPSPRSARATDLDSRPPGPLRKPGPLGHKQREHEKPQDQRCLLQGGLDIRRPGRQHRVGGLGCRCSPTQARRPPARAAAPRLKARSSFSGQLNVPTFAVFTARDFRKFEGRLVLSPETKRTVAVLPPQPKPQ